MESRIGAAATARRVAAVFVLAAGIATVARPLVFATLWLLAALIAVAATPDA